MEQDDFNKPLDYFSQTNMQLRRMEAGGQDGCTTFIVFIFLIIGAISLLF